MADGTLKVGTITNSAGSGNITIGSGVTLLSNVPAFEAYLSADQTVSDGVNAKIQFNTEIYDTDNTYDNSTNYRFTPTVAGEYFVYSVLLFKSDTASQINDTTLRLYKNGSQYKRVNTSVTTGNTTTLILNVSTVMILNGTTDYVEIYGNLNVGSGTATIQASEKSTYFGAYRIGA
jgi:hypothetical protein